MTSQMPRSEENDLRPAGDFVDAVIRVGDVEFKIHKIILAKGIPYFRALFSRWATAEQKVFDIPGVSPAMMELIIGFAYTGSVSVTAENVQELLMAADQFNVTEIVQACCEFLEEQLSTENCVGIWQFTNIILAPDLKLKALRYILDHFGEVVFSDEFQQFSALELIEILGKDDLNMKNETLVYEAVLRWIAHAPEFRTKHLSDLLSKVRLGLTSIDFITKTVMSNEMVKNDARCQRILTEGQLLDSFVTKEPAAGQALARPRLPATILLATGGWSGRDATNVIEAYDVCADRWTDVTPIDGRPRAYHGTAYLHGSLYYVGGFDRVEHSNTVRRFDLCAQTWHEASPMYYPRCYASVVTLGGYIYALGGFNGHNWHSTAECYRPETNQWSLIPPMHEQRSDASCTTLHNKIYICGGFNGHRCLWTCECYSPETRQWTVISGMTSRRRGVGVIAYADCVFAVGGYDGNNYLRSVEAYNPETNSWNEVVPMFTTRCNFGLEVINDQLFVVGGFDGHTTSSNVEFYDAKTGDWTEVTGMTVFRSILSCCVVPRLPNMADYVIPRDVMHLSQEDESREEST